MRTERRTSLTDKPGALGELALTLPIFVVYQLGVVFLDARNATDLVTARLLELSHGDRLTYLGLTAATGVIMSAVFGVLGRGQTLRWSKIVQIALEGAAYAIAMGLGTSWLVGKMFAGAHGSAAGPFAGLVMSLGAGFYEELAFRALLFGVGAKLLVWLFAHEHVRLLGTSPPLGGRGFFTIVTWAVLCSGAFSAMHYIGPLADPFDLRSFAVRAILGLALTVVYATRGFAAAVWTHALYDVWVLVL
jgi:Type II CAAX prenyl endopeptidase Rce1-like